MMLEKQAYRIFTNYFWLITITYLLAYVTHNYWLNTIVYPSIIFYLSVKSKFFSGIHNLQDFSVGLLFMLFLMSWFTNDFENKTELINYCIAFEVLPMFAYFIGRKRYSDASFIFFKNAIIPIVVIDILGIILFFWRPAWYMEQINNSSFSYLEASRMRSIFSSPYVCSYSTFFALSFILAIHYGVIPNCNTFSFMKYKKALICLFCISLLLCMQRAPIAGAVVSFLLFSAIHAKRTHSLQEFLKSIFVFSIVLMVIAYIVYLIFDKENGLFLVEKFSIAIDSEENFLENRAGLFKIEESMWGYGAGRFAHKALDYNMYSITDQQYMKILMELGYIGLSVYILLWSTCLLKCIRYYRYLGFELAVLLFLLISMSGANPLSSNLPFVFWLVIGHIASFKTNRCCLRTISNDRL